MQERNEPTQLGAAITARRQALGLSMYELARRSGVHRSRILRIESGEARHPDPRTLSGVAAALGIPSADLFALAGYKSTRELPTFRPYLRTKYGQLPADALRKLERYFERIAAEYGDHDGPAAGEDERPE